MSALRLDEFYSSVDQYGGQLGVFFPGAPKPGAKPAPKKTVGGAVRKGGTTTAKKVTNPAPKRSTGSAVKSGGSSAGKSVKSGSSSRKSSPKPAKKLNVTATGGATAGVGAGTRTTASGIKNPVGASAVAKAAARMGKQIVYKTTNNPNHIRQLAVGHVVPDVGHLTSLVRSKQYKKAAGFIIHAKDKYTTNHEHGVDVFHSYLKAGVRGVLESDIPPSLNPDNFFGDLERVNGNYGGYQQALTDIDAPTLQRVALSANPGQSSLSVGGIGGGDVGKFLGEAIGGDPKTFAKALPGCDAECYEKVAGGVEEWERDQNAQQQYKSQVLGGGPSSGAGGGGKLGGSCPPDDPRCLTSRLAKIERERIRFSI
jgi:hypothetical protein